MASVQHSLSMCVYLFSKQKGFKDRLEENVVLIENMYDYTVLIVKKAVSCVSECPLKVVCVSMSDLLVCDNPPHLGHYSNACVISTRQV